MSHANGMVQFPDKTVMHFEYNGTSDVTDSVLWDTSEEVHAHWRGDIWNECKCGRDEPVTLFTDYGGSFHWPGRACRHCRAITAGLEPDETTDGTPDWVHSANTRIPGKKCPGDAGFG